jgi:hypothetical protein
MIATTPIPTDGVSSKAKTGDLMDQNIPGIGWHFTPGIGWHVTPGIGWHLAPGIGWH